MKRSIDKRNIAWLISVEISVIIIWSLICRSKGIYPFGRMTMCVADYKAESMPILFHIWDFLHGRSSLFFDWNGGLGNNITGGLWQFSMFSPSSLFFLFIPRDYVEKGTYLYLLVKLLAIGASFGFVINKRFPKLNVLISYGATLLYVFGPYCMEYYLIPSWLDIVCVFPLVMYFADELLKNGKYKGYVISLALFLMMNFQQSFMLFILLVLYLTCLMIDRKRMGEEKIRIVLFAECSILALMIASVIFVPGFLQTIGGGRAEGTKGIIEIWKSIWVFYPDKWLKLSNVAPMLGVIAVALIKWFKAGRNKEDRLFTAELYMVVFLSLQILLESSNLLWHGGSYFSFTMRNAYMLTFFVIMSGMRVINEDRTDSDNRISTWSTVTGIVTLAVVFSLKFLTENAKTSPAKAVLITAVGFIFGTVCVTLYKKAGTAVNICFALYAVLMSYFIGDLGIMVADYHYIDKENVALASSIYSSGEYPSDVYSRVKVLSPVSSNWGLECHFQTIQTYTASTDEDHLKTFHDLGYANVGFRIDDFGGTAFTDALFGTSDMFISDKEFEPESGVPSSVASYAMEYGVEGSENKFGDYDILKSSVVYDPGILIKSDEVTEFRSVDEYKDKIPDGRVEFANQNALSHLVLGSELLDQYDSTSKVDLTDEAYIYCYIPENAEVGCIAVCEQSEEPDVGSGFVPGSVVGSVTLDDTAWRNGMVFLGRYPAGSYSIRMFAPAQKDSEDIYEYPVDKNIGIASMNVKKLNELTPVYASNYSYKQYNRGLDITAEIDGTEFHEGYDSLFVPVFATDDWKCTVNGRKTDLIKLSGGMLIPVSEGKNEIKLRYTAPGAIPGIMISIAGLLLFALSGAIVFKPEGNKTLYRILSGMIIIIAGGIILFIYVIPMFFLVVISAGKIISLLPFGS